MNVCIKIILQNALRTAENSVSNHVENVYILLGVDMNKMILERASF